MCKLACLSVGISAALPTCCSCVRQHCDAACQQLCVVKPMPAMELPVSAFSCVTCLCSSDEGSVSLAVLPVDVQVRTLRQSYDDVHKPLVTRNQQPYLRWRSENEMGKEIDKGEGLESAKILMEV